MKTAVVLLSGGLDSATTLAIAIDQGYKTHALTINYQQNHAAEVIAAKNIAASLAAQSFKLLSIPLDEIGGSSLTDCNIDVPDYEQHNTIPSTYVPARNTIFLSLALAYAEVKQADTIFIGVTHIDYSGYPDCRPQYIDAYNQLASLATKRSVEGNPVSIEAPLLHLHKADIIRQGVELGVDYGLTVSCYRLNHELKACGLCESCVIRREGFMQSCISDPTNYIV